MFGVTAPEPDPTNFHLFVMDLVTRETELVLQVS